MNVIHLQYKELVKTNKHYTFQEYLENFSSIQDSYDYYFEQQKEIDRLNNIISELEKWLKGLIDNFDESVSEPILHEQMTIRLVYDYLENLKQLKEKE